MASAFGTGNAAQWQRRLLDFLPRGHEIPGPVWTTRHRVILAVIFAHAIGLAIFGFLRGWSAPYSLGEPAAIAALGALAAVPTLGKRFRSGVAALALSTTSAVLVQFWGGFIEGHFHYFVVVAVVSLYQDWVPFLLAILYVGIDHGIIGSVAPAWVYNHPSAIAHPWAWATIHAVMVLAECAALIVVWKSNEVARGEAEVVLRSTGEGMLGIDRAGHITFTNPAAAALAGGSPDAMVGSPVERWLRLAAAAGGSRNPGTTLEGTLHRADGSTRPVEVVATPMQDKEGWVWAVKDVTERRRAEEEHAKAIEQASEIKRLHEQDEFKTLFLNTAAHELRTPLTPIKLHLHSLQSGKRGALSGEQQRVMDILKRNIDRLGQLVEEVLDVGRLQAGRLPLSTSEVDLPTLCREVVDSFGEAAGRNGVRLRFEAPDSLWAAVDARRVTQILYNLVDNALKFTPAGGSVAVSIATTLEGVAISVSDTGIGISAEDQVKLFQPFSQLFDPAAPVRGGSGLGLYISRGLAQLHGGTLTCTSAGPGKGTRFVLELPAQLVPVRKAADAVLPA